MTAKEFFDILQTAGPASGALILGYMWHDQRKRNDRLEAVVFKALRQFPQLTNAIEDLEDSIRDLSGRNKRIRRKKGEE